MEAQPAAAPKGPATADVSRLADEMQALQAGLAQAQQALHEAELDSLAKTQFLAAASHDLRQPMHALTLFADALRARAVEPDLRGLVDNISEAVNTLDDLFTQLLDASRIDAGVDRPQPADFNIAWLWQRLRLHFEPVAFDKGLALRFRGGRHVAHADPLMVERILRNLTANAIRYTADGGVLVAARRRGDRLLLQVWDSGIGIAPADQARVFDDFVQLPQARVRPADAADGAGESARRRGLGLGLAIVRRLAEQLQAPLGLQSQPGRGTLVSLALPLGPRAAPAAARQRVAPLLLGPTLAGRRMLVIEDDAFVRAELQALLQGWGAEVLATDDAQPPDGASGALDLCIIGLPLHGGLAAERDGLAQWAGRAPLLCLGQPQPAPGEAAGAGGGSAAHPPWLPKPVQANRLRAMIGHLLGSASAR